jgi:hypothetical protein
VTLAFRKKLSLWLVADGTLADALALTRFTDQVTNYRKAEQNMQDRV